MNPSDKFKTLLTIFRNLLLIAGLFLIILAGQNKTQADRSLFLWRFLQLYLIAVVFFLSIYALWQMKKAITLSRIFIAVWTILGAILCILFIIGLWRNFIILAIYGICSFALAIILFAARQVD